jgi:hypothetical protein
VGPPGGGGRPRKAPQEGVGVEVLHGVQPLV